jgi:NTE family protein
MSGLGIALGGGGARGLAHIGVLKKLEKEKIGISAITGCSMGAVIGSLYAYHGNAQIVEDIMTEFIINIDLEELGIEDINNSKKNDELLIWDDNFWESFVSFFRFRFNILKTLRKPSYFDEAITAKIFKLIPDVKIESLKIPFSAIATDLISGKEINFTRGSLREAVRASSSIPGIFPPVKKGKLLLVDGAPSESVPVGRVKEIGADRVLAVNVSHCIKADREPENVFEILYRTGDISSYHLSLERLKAADLVLNPAVKDIFWADFSNIKKIVNEGYLETKENLSEIKKLVNRNSWALELEHFLKRITD